MAARRRLVGQTIGAEHGVSQECFKLACPRMLCAVLLEDWPCLAGADGVLTEPRKDGLGELGSRLHWTCREGLQRQQ